MYVTPQWLHRREPESGQVLSFQKGGGYAYHYHVGFDGDKRKRVGWEALVFSYIGEIESEINYVETLFTFFLCCSSKISCLMNFTSDDRQPFSF